VADRELVRQLAERGQARLDKSPEQLPQSERLALGLLALEAEQFVWRSGFCERRWRLRAGPDPS